MEVVPPLVNGEKISIGHKKSHHSVMSKKESSTVGIILLIMSCISCAGILSSSVGSVMISGAEPAPKSLGNILPKELSYVVEPEPFLSDDTAINFTVEEEEVSQETFKLLSGKNYSTGDLYHYHPTSDIPFTEKRCLQDCSVNPQCKAVVFSNNLDRCWGKKMADHEIIQHSNSNSKLAYVKKDTYEEALEKYG